MKLKGLYIKILLSIVICSFDGTYELNAQNKQLSFGHMDHWVVREVKESAVIGGKTKLLYEIAPPDTLKGSKPYSNRGGSPWASSNVMAKVAGVTKGSTTVYPEKRGNGYCARMETCFESVKVLGIIDMEVIAAGSIYLGNMFEPLKSTKNPLAMFNFGIPFTEKPKAISYDYKVKLASDASRTKCTGFSRKSTVSGKDQALTILILQKRWEDENGNIYAKRVGTMVQRYDKDSEWVNNATYTILYGDITSHPQFQSHMDLQDEDRYAVNSKGKNVLIKEVEWATADEAPTHIILQFSSSHGGAYVGSPGNTFWVDNVKLVY